MPQSWAEGSDEDDASVVHITLLFGARGLYDLVWPFLIPSARHCAAGIFGKFTFEK